MRGGGGGGSKCHFSLCGSSCSYLFFTSTSLLFFINSFCFLMFPKQEEKPRNVQYIESMERELDKKENLHDQQHKELDPTQLKIYKNSNGVEGKDKRGGSKASVVTERAIMKGMAVMEEGWQ